MFIIYNLLISLVFLLLFPLLVFYLFFKPDLFTEVTERLGFQSIGFTNYLNILRKENKEIIWVNAASVGELMIARSVIEKLMEKQCNYGYIITTNSSSGWKTGKQLFGPEKVILLPLDLPWVAARVARKVKPKLTILVEFEAWPNMIHYLTKVGSKIVLVNGALDNKIIKIYKAFPGLLKTTLNQLDYLGMKTTEEMTGVEALGINSDKIGVTGDMKWDQSSRKIGEQERLKLKKELQIPESADLLIAGSTHPGEEELIVKTYTRLKKYKKDLVLLLAPRQIERAEELRQLGESYHLKTVKRTSIRTEGVSEASNHEVVILDTIGELAELYSIATVVFIGGSLVNIGGHNFFEPVIYGKPVLFGPYIQKFTASAELLMDHHIGIMVRDEDDLRSKMIFLLQDKNHVKTIECRAIELLQMVGGATQKNLEVIWRYCAKDYPKINEINEKERSEKANHEAENPFSLL